MARLIGGRATGFAQPSTRTVFLVTNADWLVEGLAQAAAFVEYMLHRYGPTALANLWKGGASVASRIGRRTLADVESQWRHQLRPTWIPTSLELDAIEAKGCG
jgi:hypothetical protein